MSKHITTLVVDYDDTIAITFNRDWQNAKPNQPLIDKLNLLYNQGWTIHIVTARGQLSCGGDFVQADHKYRDQIEKWLSNHSVKYHTLSFQKKLAAYYIDDKGITPEQFVEKFDRIDLQNGWSGASVYYDGVTGCVYKTATNSHSAIQWYEHANKLGYNTPHVHNIIGTTIRMSRLPEYTGTVKDAVDGIVSFKNHKPLNGNPSRIDYVNRCTHRITGSVSDASFKVIQKMLIYAMNNTPYTFGHGDCSCPNIMGSEKDSSAPAFIDPINDNSLYSSYVIDLAKYYASIDMFNRDSKLKTQILENVTVDHGVIKAHAVGHLCRVLPYAPTEADKQHITTLIENQIHAFR
jgi:capsule biosynthesis phosphatase